MANSGSSNTYTIDPAQGSVTVGAITNYAPINNVIIQGNLYPSYTLTANKSNIIDNNGIKENSWTYQWIKNSNPITGETNPTYSIQDNDAGSNIHCKVTYEDNQNTLEELTSNVSVINAKPIPVLSGVQQESNILTANISNLNGTLEYEWLRVTDSTTVTLAEDSNQYLLTQADVGAKIRVIVKTNIANIADVQSILTETIQNLNNPPQGNVTISGTAFPTFTLQANKSTITDDDGIDQNTWEYQWLRNNQNITVNANSSSYILVDADANQNIKCKVTYKDLAQNTGTITSAPVSIGSKAKPIITGTPEEDQKLSVSISDFNGTLSYQWKRIFPSTGISTNLGSTSTEYTLTQADVNHKIICTITSSIFNIKTNSDETNLVINVNDDPTGTVQINGILRPSNLLTTDVTGIADEDGIDQTSWTYQWKRDGNPIGGETSSTYRVVDIDIGTKIICVATYNDLLSSTHSVTSLEQTILEKSIPTISDLTNVKQNETLNSLITNLEGTLSYEWKRDNETIPGANGTSLLLTQAEVGKKIRVIVSTDITGVSPMSSAQTNEVVNVNDDPVGTVTINGNLFPSHDLSVNKNVADLDTIDTTTWTYIWKIDGVDFGDNMSTISLNDSHQGKQIQCFVGYTDNYGANETVPSNVVTINDREKPIISGVKKETEILTATIANLQGNLSYQWKRNGSNINGANTDTYTLTQADVGNRISVTVTTNIVNILPITSLETSTIVNKDNNATGTITVSGIFYPSNVLTLDDSTVADEDGIKERTYSWKRDNTIINGATLTSLHLTDADAGTQISAVLTYKDDFNVISNVESNPYQINNLELPTINGDLQEDSILTASTTNLQGNLTYKWYRNGNFITGTGTADPTYTLVQNDVNTQISVLVETDKTNVTLAPSIETSAIQNNNDDPSGTLMISGDLFPSYNIFVDVSVIQDEDGINSATLTYQWTRGSQPITTAMSHHTYAVVDADEGEQLKCVVTYQDNYNNSHTLETNTVTIQNKIKPTITGNLSKDEIITASITNLNGNLNYQWNRNGNPIPNETANQYILDLDDVNQKISVTVGTDIPGINPITSDETDPVQMINAAPTGNVFVEGILYPSNIISLNISNIADADGIITTSWTYEWLRNGQPINGATESTYLLTNDDQATSIICKASYQDNNLTNELVISDANIINNSILPTIVGQAIVTNELTIMIDNTLLGNKSYQWKRNGLNINNATNNKYNITQNDVGSRLSVEVSIDIPNVGPLESLQTNPVILVNNLPTGTVQLSGLPYVTNTITSNITNINDIDGIKPTSWSYNWIRDDQIIDGKTDSDYILVDSDNNKEVKCIASYQDNAGTDESVSSATLNVTKSKPTISGILEINQILSGTIANFSGYLTYQWKRNGQNIPQAKLLQYQLKQADVDQKISFEVSTDITNVSPTISDETLPILLFNNAPQGNVSIIGELHSSYIVEADITNIVDPNGIKNNSWTFQWKRNSNDLSNKINQTYRIIDHDIGKNMSCAVSYRDHYDKLETIESNVFLVHQRTLPVISGLPHESNILTAIINKIQFENQLTYKWRRNNILIPNTNSDHYILNEKDVGKNISVTVESDINGVNPVTSNKTPIIIGKHDITTKLPEIIHYPLIPDPPVWAPNTYPYTGPAYFPTSILKVHMNNMVTPTGIKMDTVTYQWRRNNVAINNENKETYTATDLDIDNELSVQITYMDSLDNLMTLIKVAGIVMPNATPTIVGKLNKWEVISVLAPTYYGKSIDTTDLTKTSPLQYQWYSDGKPIVGETSSTLRLKQVHVRKRISVAVISNVIGVSSIVSELSEIVRMNMTATGDPYITTIYGKQYKMDDFTGFARMIQGYDKENNKLLTVNAETKLLTSSEIDELHQWRSMNKNKYGIGETENTFENRKATRFPAFFTRLFVAYGDENFVVNLNTLEIEEMNYSVKRTTVKRVMAKEYDWLEIKSEAFEKSISVGKFVIHVTKYRNPEVRTGFILENCTGLDNMNGAMVNTIFVNDMRLRTMRSIKPLKRITDRQKKKEIKQMFTNVNGENERRMSIF